MHMITIKLSRKQMFVLEAAGLLEDGGLTDARGGTGEWMTSFLGVIATVCPPEEVSEIMYQIIDLVQNVDVLEGDVALEFVAQELPVDFLLVEHLHPAHDHLQIFVRRELEERAIDGRASDSLGPAHPPECVDATHVHGLAVTDSLSGEIVDVSAELPLGAATNKEHVELIPWDILYQQTILADIGYREAQLPDARHHRQTALQRLYWITHYVWCRDEGTLIFEDGQR